MFRYVYSVLLLAVTKPACDHIIRMITKNTDAKVEDSTTSINFQLQKLTTELLKRGKTPEQIQEIIESLAAKLESLREDVAEVRKLVLESRKAAHEDALSLHNEHVQIHSARRTR